MAANEVRMTAEDKKWRAESDARTLMEAAVIKKDRARLAAALVAAKRLAKEKADESKSINSVLEQYKKIKRGKK